MSQLTPRPGVAFALMLLVDALVVPAYISEVTTMFGWIPPLGGSHRDVIQLVVCRYECLAAAKGMTVASNSADPLMQVN